MAENSQADPPFSEVAPLTFQQSNGLPQPVENPNVYVQMDQRDVSRGRGIYSHMKPYGPNLSVGPWINGAGICAHANIEVDVRTADGKKAKMSERYIRSWVIAPLTKSASVDNLMQWRIQGLDHNDFNPFSPMRMPNENQPFDFWETFHRTDAPGFCSPKGDVGGQLQEFVVGSPGVGGAYFQVYALSDKSQIRTITTKALTFDAKGYADLVKALKNPTHRKKFLHKLYYMPDSKETDETSTFPKRVPKLQSVRSKKKP